MQKVYFENQNYYHLYNRGVAKQKIFLSDPDYKHLLTTFGFYLESQPKTKLSQAPKKELRTLNITAPKEPLIEILCYCLMPNHFHLLIKQTKNGGTSIFMRRSLDSYTRYFNTRNNRVGTIFQGKFKAVHVEDDEQLIHLTRYIHLNPFISQIEKIPNDYPWSSLNNYLKNQTTRTCHPKFVLDVLGNKNSYSEFTKDYASYIQYRELSDRLLIDDNE